MTPRTRWVAAAAIALATACTGKTGPAGQAGTTEGTITGFVRAPDGDLPGATVVAQPGDFTTTSAADGGFTLRLPVGVYTLSLQKDGYVPLVTEPISIIAGGLVEAGYTLSPEPAPQVQALAGADRFQEGFGAQVQLDGSASSTGPGITYQWTQVARAGPEVQLTGADTATPSFTTLTLEELEAGGFYAIRRSLGTLGFSEADVDHATYEFELTVTDGVTASTDRVIVRSVVAQPGLAVVPVDTVVPLSAGDQADYAWTCTFRDTDGNQAPCAPGVISRAGTRTPTFRAGQAGTFTFVTAGEAALEVRAAFYAGARPVTGATTCASCHDAALGNSEGRTLSAKYGPWAATRHATYLERALTGQLVDAAGQPVAYQGECLRCHATGFNPGAQNGGFSQVAAAELWAFPNTYEAMSEPLKALASVTCESCHGPGGLHALDLAPQSIGKSFAAVDCAQCHATEPYENQGLQWVNSRHSRFITGFRPDAEDPALRGTCASCHSSQGFVAWARTGTNAAPPVGADVTEPQTCAACHDPHGEALAPDGQPTPKQLRVYGDVTTAVAGVGARGVGPSALCMTCHNSGTSVAVAAVGTPVVPATQAAPHTPSQADVLLAKNAATLGGPGYPTSAHTGVPRLCAGCHMAPTPARGAPGHNLVGGHSFAMRAGGLLHTAACTGCHAGLDTFDRTAHGDYDGDGFLEGIQSEVTGLGGLVQEQLSLAAARLWPAETGGGTPAVVKFHGRIRVLKDYVAGVSDAACNPAVPADWPESCFAFAAQAIPQVTPSETAFLGAAWNYFLVEGDRSRGVHNTAFSVAVLQRSYQALAGEPVPGAVIR